MQAAITFSAPCRNSRPQFITRRRHPSSPLCGTNGCYSAGWCSRTTRASSFFRDAARSRLRHNRRIRRDKFSAAFAEALLEPGGSYLGLLDWRARQAKFDALVMGQRNGAHLNVEIVLAGEKFDLSGGSNRHALPAG